MAEGDFEENPAKNTILSEHALKSTKDKSDVPVIALTPFWQDITNHPVLWVCVSIFSFFSSFFTIVLCYLCHPCVWLMLLDWPQEPPSFRKACLLTPFLVLPLLLIAYALASLIAATQTSCWENESNTDILPTQPSFGARFWRFMRFTFPHNILPIFGGFYTFMYYFEDVRTRSGERRSLLNKKQKIGIAIHSIPFSLLTCAAGLAYGYFRKNQHEDKTDR